MTSPALVCTVTRSAADCVRATSKASHPLAVEHALDDLAYRGRLPREPGLGHDRDLGAEPSIGLRELEANGTAADHDEVRGQSVVIEDGLVREKRRFGKPVDRGDPRPGPRRDDDSVGGEHGRSDPEGLRV